MENKSVIGDIRGVYGVGNISNDFLYALSLRSILWGGSENNEIILPPSYADLTTHKIKYNLLNVLSIPETNLKEGDFTQLSQACKRQPYMNTPYYYKDDIKCLETMRSHLDLVKYLGDKVNLAKLLLDSGLDDFLPSNTKVYFGDNLFEQLKFILKEKFNNQEEFIIKAGEGASGENMILISKNKVYYSKLSTYVEVKDITELFEHINKSIDFSNVRTILIQDLIDTSNFVEKSINFYIVDNKFYLITSGKNIAINGIHRGNVEEILNETIIEKFKPILKLIINKGYTGPIGFDFFVRRDLSEIKILEANTRFTAPITPSMLVYKLLEQRKIPALYTWELIQKFETSIDLNLISELNEFNLAFCINNQKDIDSAKFLVYSPIFGNKYQSVIFIGPDHEAISNLKKRINLLLNKYNLGNNYL